MEIFVRTDIVCIARHWEDNSAVLASSYYVVIEHEDGARLAHHFRFIDRKIEYTEDGEPCYPRLDSPELEAKANALRDQIEAHLKAGGKLDPELWNEVDPRYGSSAYMALDAWGFFRERERQEARDRGEAVPNH